MTTYIISDTITEFRTYEVEANTYEEAAALIDQYVEDDPKKDVHPSIKFLDRGITDRFQQEEYRND